MKKQSIIKGIIDLLTKYGGQNENTKYFTITDNLSVDCRPNDGNILKIVADVFTENRFNQFNFDGKNNQSEYFIIWVEFESGYERLCNLDLIDIEKIWNYMLKKIKP